MLALYVPGSTFLHRLPATAKLALLLFAGIAVFLTSSLPLLGAAAAAAGVLLFSVRAPLNQMRRQLFGPFLVIAMIFIASAALDGRWSAGVVLLRLATLVLIALAVTLATRASDMLDACEAILRPFERTGVLNAARVSLAVSLVLRFVPEIFKHYQDIREAQMARGLEGNPVALMVPLLVRTLKSADDIATAIDSRCYPPPRRAFPSHMRRQSIRETSAT